MFLFIIIIIIKFIYYNIIIITFKNVKWLFYLKIFLYIIII